jgi:hypothetical protein
MKKTIIDNLNKNCISYQVLNDTSVRVDKSMVPTILWLKYIFTCGNTYTLTVLPTRLEFTNGRERFSVFHI